MAGLSVSGLSSGIDSASIISQLMAVESQSQTALKTRVTAGEKAISALQSINTRLSSVLSATAKLTAATSLGVTSPGSAWTGTTATSTSSSVTAAATGTSAKPGSVSFTVTQVAAAHSVATGYAVAADDQVVPSGGQLTITKADGTATTLTPGGNGTLADVASALNGDASLGLRASVLQVEPGQYRLQVTSSTTGSASTFGIDGLDGAGGTVEIATGRDAVIDLGGGLTVSSATGTYSDVLPGTTFTVKSVSYDTVTVGLEKDTSGTTASAKALVDTVNVALSELRSQSATKTGGAAADGPLAGDSLVRGLTQGFLASVTAGDSAAPAGIQLARDGTLTFDEATFTQALADDPAKVQALVAGLAERVAAVAKGASDPTTGTITTSITSRQGTVKDMDAQVDAWDTRLALRQTALERQFAAMETALSGLNAQSSYIASQISGLPSWSS